MKNVKLAHLEPEEIYGWFRVYVEKKERNKWKYCPKNVTTSLISLYVKISHLKFTAVICRTALHCIALGRDLCTADYPFWCH
jgi:hypothetical protein